METRRNFLIKIGIALNAIAALLLSVPIIGYLAGALRTRKEQAWIPLGALSEFPIGQTRLAKYDNPFTVPWDGETGSVPCWVRRIAEDQVRFLRSAAPTSTVRCVGSPNRGSSCVPATAACTTPTASMPPDRRRADSTSTSTRSTAGNSWYVAAACRRSRREYDERAPAARRPFRFGRP